MSLLLFEDEHLLAINKPAGWNTHAPAPFAGEGVYEWLKHREPRWAALAIIHRLDKETSGLLVFGKTPLANRSLTEQFSTRTVRKKYLLLTDRSVKRSELTARSSIVRAGEKYVSRPWHAGGERAETHFSIASAHDGRTRIEAEPLTGRTHQIRVHAAEHGFPILGDRLYGGTDADRIFLHSASLLLKHPATGKLLELCAPCDWEMGEPAAGFRSPDTLRAAVIEGHLTDSCRLIHGSSDGCPGVYVDKLGEFLLASSESPAPSRDLLPALTSAHRSRGVYHKRLDRNIRRATAGESSPQRLSGKEAPDRFFIRENGLGFEMSFGEGYSVGLFLDQRDNRRRFLINHVGADFPLFPGGAAGMTVLNTFCYTCGFSVAAAKTGARTTNLDLSKKYLAWGQRNFALNGLDYSQHDFVFGDAFDWLRRWKRKRSVFDCVILDPPTFSQSRASGQWQAEKDYGTLVEAALPLLKPRGVLFASTNAARLRPERYLDLIEGAVSKSGRKTLQRLYVPQPPDFPVSRDEPAYLKTVWLRME